jgi:hypothetical protein
MVCGIISQKNFGKYDGGCDQGKVDTFRNPLLGRQPLDTRT